VEELVYVSPIQPSTAALGMGDHHITPSFSNRSGYIFFGYNNIANRNGLQWFADEVMPLLAASNVKEKLFVAGTVHIPSICRCDAASSCRSLSPLIECYGAISDDGLNHLIQSVKVAINPVLEPSGVATKTCRAMALGTPVVVTSKDGTFNSGRVPLYSARCDVDQAKSEEKKSETAQNFANELLRLLQDEDQWEKASEEAPAFILEHFGVEAYMRNWISIMQRITQASLHVVIQGDARCSHDMSKDSIACLNWFLAKTFASILEVPLRVYVIAETNISPPIKGVELIHPAEVYKGAILRKGSLSRSPFNTAFESSFMIRHYSATDENETIFCGPSCRVLTWKLTASVAQHQKLKESISLRSSGGFETLIPSSCMDEALMKTDEDAQCVRESVKRIERLLQMELSEPSSRDVIAFPIPNAIRSCFVGKFAARAWLDITALRLHCLMPVGFFFFPVLAWIFLRQSKSHSQDHKRKE
jgi:hypothetical protein